MTRDDIKRLKPLSRFCYWVTERELIRREKEAEKPQPWTDDVILQRYRFTNVRRMDDHVSRWLLDNWYNPNLDHPCMLYAVALARFINRPEPLSVLAPLVFDGGPDWEGIKTVLRAFKKSGQPVFNTAYMVRGRDGPDKIASVVDYYIRPLQQDPPEIDRESMEKTWQALVGRYGFGSFMAGQIVADLRWSISGSWKDRRRWAPTGPGSVRGLNKIHGRPAKSSVKQKQFLTELRILMRNVRKTIPQTVHRRLEAHDYQNCLCEFSKYEAALWGECRPKELFRGPRAKYFSREKPSLSMGRKTAGGCL